MKKKQRKETKDKTKAEQSWNKYIRDERVHKRKVNEMHNGQKKK
jgi:hypothetical protein